MSIKAVIFDLDGTLLDTLEDLATAANAVLARRGYPEHQTALYKTFVGDGLQTLMERITPDSIRPHELEGCCQDFIGEYKQCWDRSSKPYPGVETMLRDLASKGMRLAVLSNKPHAFTTIHVERFFPEHHFDCAFGQRDGVAKKPDPAAALEIAAQLGLTTSQCAYVGDSGVDMRTGKAAGMLTIGVLWGFRSLIELQQNNADLIVEKPEEIVYHVTTAA